MSDTNDTPNVLPQPTEEGWFKTTWRPAMAWQYFAVCLFDFLLAPLLTAWYSYYTKTPYVPWKPITLSEGAAYHLAMGAIVGISAYMRGREKTALIETMSYNDRYNSSNNPQAGSNVDFNNETERRIREARQKQR